VKPLVVTCPRCARSHTLSKVPSGNHFVVLCAGCGDRLRVRTQKILAWWRVRVEGRPRAA
jgi:transcription elongation factor Elf1